MMLRKHPYLEQLLQGIFLIALICLLGISLSLFHDIGGTARVINYAGIVRGCTQRVVKLELNGEASEELMEYLDEILQELQHGGDAYHLVVIDSNSYQNELKRQQGDWEELKAELHAYRLSPTAEKRNAIVERSEKYWTVCDKTVSIAESYSEELASLLRKSEIAIIVLLILLSMITLHRSLIAAATFRKNVHLNRKAYEDSLTGLKNRQYFEEFFKDLSMLHHGYSFVFVDLDRLKFVNDTFGHEEGDRYICSVTELLRSQFRASDVMFRMGGDEFAVFLEECQESVAVQLLENVRKKVMADKSRGYEGSFSYGVVYVEPYAVRRARDILDESDRRMYEYKKAHNKERK